MRAAHGQFMRCQSETHRRGTQPREAR